MRPPHTLLLPFAALLAALSFPAPDARAQAAPGAPAAAAPRPAGEAERMLGVLRDETRRAELVRGLEALAAAERAARGGGTGAAPAGMATPAAPPATSGATAPAAGTGVAGSPAGGQTGPAAAPAGTATPGTPAPAPAEAPPAGAGTAAPAAAAAPATPAVLAPDTLGAQIINGASERLRLLAQQAMSGARALTDLPNVAAWASGVARDPVTRARIMDASWKLLLVLGAGLLAEIAVFRLLRSPRDRLDAQAPTRRGGWSWVRRMPVVAGRLLLDLVPVAVFAFVANAAVELVDPLPTTQLVMVTAIGAYIGVRAIMVASRMLFSPASAHLRMVPLRDETAAYITVWLRRLVAVSVFGYALAEAALQFGVPWAVYDGILRTVMLVVSLLLVIVILQNRAAVSHWLRAPVLHPGDVPSRSRRVLRAVRDRLAAVWHVVAILWLLALWGVWALEVKDGFRLLLRGTGSTLLILMAAKGVDYALRWVVERGLRVGPELSRRYPGLEERSNRYTHVLQGAATAVVTLSALLLILEAWGVSAFDWFLANRLGSRLLGSIVSVGLTWLVALAVWEVANAAIARQLAKVSRDAQAARSARVRTLLPMLRTALMIVIVIFVVLNVLSEIGVNVAPLIAGASVVGVAVGFGSQKLVQDIVTGIFLLLEDAVAVGDTVTLGTPPLTGVVERLSIRSIRLRAIDGAVHIIPFSSVNAVTNMTRDFAFAMVEFSLAYGQDVDAASGVLREVAKDLRAEARWNTAIRDELDVMGVERLSEGGVVLRARIKTDPSQRWPVTRELNRRISNRFNQTGLIIATPFRTPAEEPGGEPVPA